MLKEILDATDGISFLLDQEETEDTETVIENENEIVFIEAGNHGPFFDEQNDVFVKRKNNNGVLKFTISDSLELGEFEKHIPLEKKLKEKDQQIKRLLFSLANQEKIVNMFQKRIEALAEELMQEKLRPPNKGGSEFEKFKKHFEQLKSPKK